jgi:hypothetical protein
MLRKSIIIARLRAAAKLMLGGGYLKGKLSDNTGAHCALGAIYATCTGSKAAVECEAVIDHVAKMVVDKIPAAGIHDKWNHMTVTPTSKTHQQVFAWNNNIADSAADVACVFNATADLLEEDSDDE